ncbi:MAG TPA: hypothetical protein PLM71_09950 [Syntrophorhabdaceae bacterium]|nr:hypothetical protein [Syntrophorhabdaceae bacterium]
MTEEERLQKMKRLKDELTMAYITDGLLVGLTHDEAMAFIEESFQRVWEKIESIRLAIEECKKHEGKIPEGMVLLTNEDNQKLVIGNKDNEYEKVCEYDTPEYYAQLEIKNMEFVEKLLNDKYSMS